jgi:hypothetical protein
MKRVILLSVATIGAVALTLPAASARGQHGDDTRVTRDATAGSYLRYDGASDATTQACSTGRRAQNEPTIAVDPHNTAVLAAGSNDYCAAIVNGDVWVGFYRSGNGGGTWQDSLVPGYPADTSPAGLASPAHGVCSAAGDPTQAFDNSGRLFYGFICFNRAQPVNGSVYVASYGADGATYVRTTLVARGTPGAGLGGVFQDKPNLVVDQTAGPHSGNVYMAWSQFSGAASNNAILFSRSTNHGVTFSNPIRVTPVEVGSAEFADLWVAPNGTIYLTFRTYPSPGTGSNAIWLTRSTDGGLSFSTPVLVSGITPFISSQFSGNGAGDCGDGPFACPSGYTFERFDSLSAVAADASGVHVVWTAELPSGQAKIFVRNSPDGVHWTGPAATLDSVSTGHQWDPDIATSNGVLSVVFYDSRADSAYSPDRPPGNTAGGANSGNVIDTRTARSTDGGSHWTETVTSGAASNFNWETHGSLRIPFWGDYNYIASVAGVTAAAWTDSRDLIPGTDPRETGATDDHDGFDGYQTCTWVPNDINAPSYTSPTVSDPCESQGGLDQNIYAAQM